MFRLARGDLGRESARHFDRIILREDVRFRGRVPGETAGLIVQGAKEAQAEVCRLKQIEVVLDEIEATRVGVEWANPGDLAGGLRGPGPRRVGRAADPRTPGAGRGGRVRGPLTSNSPTRQAATGTALAAIAASSARSGPAGNGGRQPVS